MHLGKRRDLAALDLQADAAVERVDSGGHERDERKRGKRPVDDELNERQAHHVEADVLGKERVFGAEIHRVAKQRPVLPLRSGRRSDEKAEHDRHDDAQRPRTTGSEAAIAGECALLWCRRYHVGSQPVGNPHVERKHDCEEHGERGSETEPREENPPEHVGTANRLVPQHVDIKRRHTARRHEDEHDGKEHDREHDTTAPRSTERETAAAECRTTRQITRDSHDAECYLSSGTTRQRHPACASGCACPVGNASP